MEIKLIRKYLKDSYTIGQLYINGTYFCDTVEDRVRDLNKDGDLCDCGESKVYGKTAIPYGAYEVTIKVKSPKYSCRASYNWCKGYLPRLIGVPHFDGILIHAGNTADDSAGCIIVGRNKTKGKVIDSMVTLKELYKRLEQADTKGETIKILIE